MSLSKHTKAELIELLENASTSERPEASSEAAEPKANTQSEAKPSASQPVFLVVGVFIALAILAWIIL